MIYDADNELTEDEMKQLSEDEFFEYLDSQTEYLKQFTKPLGEYHTKRYASIAASVEGRELTDDEFDFAKKVGKEGDEENYQRIIDKMEEKDLKEPDKYVKNVKTNRSQWFD
jgi:ribosomal protein L12E/L44/L45/RPP1/RPP2